MGVHVYSNEQLIKISGANSYTELTDAPNIVPQGQGVIISDSVTIDTKGTIESSKTDSSLNISNVNTTTLKAENILFGVNKDRNLEDELVQVTGTVNALEEQDKFLIQDSSKNTILKVDKDGLTTTEVHLPSVSQPLSNAINDLTTRTAGINEQNSDDSIFCIQDENNFTILKVDESGLTTTDVILSELDVYDGNVADAIEGINTKIGEDSVEDQIDSAISAIKGDNLSEEYNTLEKIEGKIEDLNTKTSGIDSATDEAMFIIQDNTENKNTILKVDNTGLITTHIHLNDLQKEVSVAIKDNTTDISENAKAIAANATNIKNNTDAIVILNSGQDVKGSVDQKINDAMISIVDGAPETYDTFLEVYEYINAHQGEATSIMNNINDINTRTAGIDSQSEDVFIIQDNTEKKNTILKVDKDGLVTTDVTLVELYNIDNSTEGKVSKSIQNLDTKITAVDNKVGTDSVETQINSAITTLKNGASIGSYDTLKGIEDNVLTIKENLETKIETDIDAAVNTLTGNVQEYDTLEKLESAINNTDNRTAGISSEAEDIFVIQDNQVEINTIAKIDSTGLITTDVTLSTLGIDNGSVSTAITSLHTKVGADSVANQINSAINTFETNIINGADYSNFKEIQDDMTTLNTEKVDSDYVERTISSAIDNIKGDVSDDYNTLEKIANKIENVFSKNIITCTKAEYESFGSSVQSDNKIYFIK